MRADLLALTPDTLAELTNRGLVKRATREVEREAPALTEDADGTVHATTGDGTVTKLPTGGLEAGTCSCGAPGVCRHVVGLVLAYPRWAGGADGPDETGAGKGPGGGGPGAADDAGSGDGLGGGGNREGDQPAAAERVESADKSGAGPTRVESIIGDVHPGVGGEDGVGARPGAANVPDAQTQPGTGSVPDTRTQARTCNVPDTQTQADTADVPDARTQADADDVPDARTQADADNVPDSQAQAGTGDVPDARTQAGARGGVDNGKSTRGRAHGGVDDQPHGPGRSAHGGGAGLRGGWSPGEFTDEELAGRIGGRMLAAARRVERGGYVARVHRGRPGDPVPTVELPTVTVRFLVPRDLGFARTDAVAGVRDDVLALAVWAFRVADVQAPGEADVQVQVGGSAGAATTAGLERAVGLAGLVLREGAIHLGAGIGGEVAAVRRGLEAARMRWPLLAVDDLVAQLDAYRERSARYRPEALADHVAELFARHRAVVNRGASLASRVLGTDEASETPLRRARFDGLGARVSVVGDERAVDVFLAHGDSTAVLVLSRAYQTEEAGPRLAERRVAGVTLGALAGGAVVTESASRSASRAVRLGTRRLSRTEAMATRGAWENLPRTLLVDDYAALATELDALPPRPIRARVSAELVRVMAVAEVRSVSYAPGAQRVDAVVADAAGHVATISATHASCAPGRLDAVVGALRGGVRQVAGTVRRGGGGLVIDPIGFAGDGGVVVPDLAPAAPGADPRDRAAPETDPLGRALDEALALLAEVAHRGLRHLPPTTGERLRAAAGRLRATGLRRAAEAIVELAARLGPDPGEEAVTAWVDAYLRVGTAAETRS